MVYDVLQNSTIETSLFAFLWIVSTKMYHDIILFLIITEWFLGKSLNILLVEEICKISGSSDKSEFSGERKVL